MTALSSTGSTTFRPSGVVRCDRVLVLRCQVTGFKRADLYPRVPFPMQNVEASVAWQQGVWTAALADGRAPACRDCGMSDLPVEGGCRCPYCFELWLLRWERDPAGAYEIAMGRLPG